MGANPAYEEPASIGEVLDMTVTRQAGGGGSQRCGADRADALGDGWSPQAIRRNC